MDYKFNPEVHLEQDEIASLASVMSHPGYKVSNKVFRQCVDWFIGEMINAEQHNKEEVLAKHNAAKVAAQLYTLFVNRVNNEVAEYVHSAPNDKKPINAAEGLDLGDIDLGTEEEPLY